METKEDWDLSPYGTKTTKEVFKIVDSLYFKGYENIQKHKNPYGYSNIQSNFFIWKKKRKEEYIRICLISEGWRGDKVFYWNVEFSFKPFGKIGEKWKSEGFKGTANDLYLNRLLEAIGKIKIYLRLGKK